MAAYFWGINCAIIVTRLLIRRISGEHGSGNAGATNVLRSQGKLPALLTTVGDLAKSIVAVLLGGLFMKILSLPGDYSNDSFVVFGAYFAGLFCIIGHIYPFLFRVPRRKRGVDHLGDDADSGLEGSADLSGDFYCRSPV